VSGKEAASRTHAAEAVERERVALAERWIKLAGNERLRIHAVTEDLLWYARMLDSGLESHGAIKWADLKRALAIRP
jgi:hypothetical protein